MKIGLSNPFNYTGSKHRYLKDLKEVLPIKDDLTVLDPFFGGGDLSIHLNETWAIDAVDSCKQLIEMHTAIKNGQLTVDDVLNTIAENNLSKTNKQEFIEFRKKYNSLQNPIDLYALICHSNSNRMKFSKLKDEFNIFFGERTFNQSLIKKLNDYIERLSVRDVSFYCNSAFEFDFGLYDLVLIDPPYLNTSATYNENNGWSTELEERLINKTESECKKFVWFGQTWSKGVKNELLSGFGERHNCKILANTTSKCSSNRKGGKTVEVMICN